MKNAIFSILGFLLFAFGLIGLILSLVGLNLTLFSWLPVSAFADMLIKLSLIMIGLIMMYMIRLKHE